MAIILGPGPLRVNVTRERLHGPPTTYGERGREREEEKEQELYRYLLYI